MTSTLLKRPQVEDLVRLSRSTIYSMIARGEFPEPIKVGRRAVAWRTEDVEAWIRCRERGEHWV